MKKRINKQAGFTLIELIVVIAIIGILAAVLIPNFAGFVEKAKEGADKADIRNLNSVTIAYRAEEPPQDIFLDINKSDAQLMEFLVEQEFIGQVLVPRSENGSFEWDFQLERWVLGSNEGTVVVAKTVAENVLEKAFLILEAIAKKDPTITISKFLTTVGKIPNTSATTGNTGYRTWILNNNFEGTWPDFPPELQGKVGNIPDLKVMPFFPATVDNDPIIYASTETENNWFASLYYSDGSWYKRNPAFSLTSSFTNSDLAAKIKNEPTLWTLVE